MLYIIKSAFSGDKHVYLSQATLKIFTENGKLEISVAADDSCGALVNLSRLDVRIFFDDKDITKSVLGSYEAGHISSFNELAEIVKVVEEYSKI